MAISDRTTLQTPEGVSFGITIGGLGSRFSAALIDSIVQVLMIVILSSIGSSSFDGPGATQRIIVAIGVFLVLFGYYFICEAWFGGRTIGKKMTGLRVVNDMGGPVSVRQSAVRNLVRFADFLPFMYIVGMSTILGSPRSQRLGDLAAGTRVIVEPGSQRRWRSKVPVVSGFDNTSLQLSEAARAELATWDVVGITRNDIGIVQQFLARRTQLDFEARTRIADEFAAKLRPRVHGVHPTIPNERFLECLVEAKQIRR